MTNQFLVHKKTHPSQPRTTQLRAKPRPEFLSVSRNSLHVSSPTSRITCQSMSPSLAESNATFCRKIVVASPNLLLLEAKNDKKCAKIPCHTHKKLAVSKIRHPGVRSPWPSWRWPNCFGSSRPPRRSQDWCNCSSGIPNKKCQLSKVKETFCYLSLNPGWLKRESLEILI